MSAYKLFTFLFLLISPFVFSQNTIKHKVTKGESIYLIAKKYQVKQTAIYALNPGIEGKILQLNTILLIPSKEQNQLNNSLSTAKEHTVVSGESLYKISRKYGISVQELARLNPTVVEKLPIGYHLILKEEVPIIEVDTTNYAVIPEIVKDSTNIVVEPTKTTVLLETAFENLGAKYKRGGTTPNGFDCSGFIYTTFKEIDITLPRSSRDQAKIGTKINRSEAKKGDLIFFATNGKKNINHVGLITEIIGDEIKFIHSSTSLGVIISSTKEAYYARTFKQINTILQSFF